MNRLLSTFLAIALCLSSSATTWDEPWQKEIIQKSEYFAFGKVVFASDSLIKVELSKSFGKSLTGTISIDGFFLLDLCSYSEGHGAEFRFAIGNEAYFFLKQGNNGNYKMPTPTSGFQPIVEGNVHATYRHSYHQAALSIEDFELTYTEIWNKYHGDSYDKAKIIAFINENLNKEPAGFEDDEIDLFFKQHAALESAYLLDISLDFEILERFASCDNFHANVSAIRAMSNLNNSVTKSFLISYLKNKDQDDFTKVIAIWSLWKMNDPEVNKQLWKLRKKLSNEANGFGGNIMDPRVCTTFPSPQRAIIQLTENKTLAEKIQNI